MELKEIREKINKNFVERDLLKNQLSEKLLDFEKFDNRYNNALKARAILQTVAKNVQEHFQDHFSKLVSMALESVFGDRAYKFLVEFEEIRGKTECRLLFERDGYKIDPLSSSSGGMIDIACLALRIAFLILSTNRRTVFLDEPAKNLQKDLYEAFGLMIRKLSKELDMQFIIVSHLPDLINTGDRIIEIENINGISGIGEVIENDNV